MLLFLEKLKLLLIELVQKLAKEKWKRNIYVKSLGNSPTFLVSKQSCVTNQSQCLIELSVVPALGKLTVTKRNLLARISIVSAQMVKPVWYCANPKQVNFTHFFLAWPKLLVQSHINRYYDRPEGSLINRCKNQFYDWFRGLTAHQIDSGSNPEPCDCVYLSKLELPVHGLHILQSSSVCLTSSNLRNIAGRLA